MEYSTPRWPDLEPWLGSAILDGMFALVITTRRDRTLNDQCGMGELSLSSLSATHTVRQVGPMEMPE